ncbi:MAG: hypothetical protein EXQ79_01835 [Acidimicrobiia bacterium]|nr:hypothetical protein [Acidimicrobiia bacterium]
MSFRLTLILLNVLVIGGLLGVVFWRVFSLRRSPESTPANLTPFLEDEALEGRRLERVLGWTLLFSVVMILSLLAYFLWEPFRQPIMEDGFLERSVDRGAVLFANKASEHYNSEFSLLCADCHGVDGTGGVAIQTLQPEADECQLKKNKNNPDVPECAPQQVQWTAPNLTLAPLRYKRAQLIDIVTYGREGTPMPAWGVKSGKGPKNVQSINDLVNYLQSIKVTSDEAMKNAETAVDDYRKSADALVKGLQDESDKAAAALLEAQADPATSADDLDGLQSDADRLAAELALAITYRDDVEALTDGGVLFRLNCARCHTKGWSYYENDPANIDMAPLPAMGSGAYGPNLTNGSVLLQFPGKVGQQNQTTWVTDGVPEQGVYGVRGISSGRMPHFGKVLTKEQIAAIIEYERSL